MGSSGFTVRLADEVCLGVDLVPHMGVNHALRIRSILQNGAIAAWNHQCFDGTSKIVSQCVPQRGYIIDCISKILRESRNHQRARGTSRGLVERHEATWNVMRHCGTSRGLVERPKDY